MRPGAKPLRLHIGAATGTLRVMALPWQLVDRAETADGVLELRRRAADDVLLTIDGRVLMSSRANRSEVALAELACAGIAARPRPRVLIGGLGLGFTLRAALDALPATAQVTVAELNPAVAAWCAGTLRDLHGDALADPRATLEIGDVTAVVRRAAATRRGFDAIVYDLYVGPGVDDDPRRHPLFGEAALAEVRAALLPGGVFAVWAEQPWPPFTARLRRLGFTVRTLRPGRGGLRHAVYLAGLAGGAARGPRRPRPQGDLPRGRRVR